jgi:hypothetical protein
MHTYMRKAIGAGLLGLSAVTMPACNDFVTVKNPSNLEADAIDPERDASLLSQSVYTRFVTSLEGAYVLGAWFTNHARVGDTFPTRNAVGQRNIPNSGNETDAIWNGIHTTLQFARTTIKSTESAGNTLDLARAWWVSGFSILNMAEYFCEGTIAESASKTRSKMSVTALLDSGIADLRKAQTIIAALTPATTEGTNLSNAAQVGIARALLQKGDKANASIEAAKVANSFSYSILHIDNPSQRGLGNQIWSFSESRISLVVGPEFRALRDAGDTRISYTNMNRLAQDGELQFYRQGKHPGWAANMRFASGLEAQYIKVEADQDPVAMYAFINTRRAAGAKAALAPTTDLTVLNTQLMLEKSIDFWLEGHEMRDFRRNPTIYPFILPTGNNYYKPQLGPVGTDTCWPVPRTELERNLNWNG